jgi:hypothetical protein
MQRLLLPTGRAAACLSLLAALAACGDPCTNTERSRVRAPDGRHDAVAFGRVCARRGAPAAPATAQLSVVAPGEPVVGVGNVLGADRDLPLELRWTGPAALHVRYPRQGDVGMRREIDGVHVTYDSSAVAPATPPSP